MTLFIVFAVLALLVVLIVTVRKRFDKVVDKARTFIVGDYKLVISFITQKPYTVANGDCIEPLKTILSILGLKFQVVLKYCRNGDIPSINIDKMRKYISIKHRIITKYSTKPNGKGKAYVKDGICYDNMKNFPYSDALVYFDTYDVTISVNDINDCYSNGKSLLTMVRRVRDYGRKRRKRPTV